MKINKMDQLIVVGPKELYQIEGVKFDDYRMHLNSINITSRNICFLDNENYIAGVDGDSMVKANL